MSRRNGHTFRQMCEVLAKVSGGTDFVYTGGNSNAVAYYFWMAIGIAMVLKGVKISRKKKEIQFPGDGGKIWFEVWDPKKSIAKRGYGLNYEWYKDD